MLKIFMIKILRNATYHLGKVFDRLSVYIACRLVDKDISEEDKAEIWNRKYRKWYTKACRIRMNLSSISGRCQSKIIALRNA